MAARLNLAGIGAAAISGSTPTVARRYFLDRFQGGQIRVLCNHSVLTTGFDAPRTDMVLIARQVFSPVRYMQMVGRGLRGEKNGGTASCRIVTVVDNLGRFESSASLSLLPAVLLGDGTYGSSGRGAVMRFTAYPKYKPSGVEWLGDVPEHWDVKRARPVGNSPHLRSAEHVGIAKRSNQVWRRRRRPSRVRGRRRRACGSRSMSSR
jgi:hypothetical protein